MQFHNDDILFVKQSKLIILQKGSVEHEKFWYKLNLIRIP